MHLPLAAGVLNLDWVSLCFLQEKAVAAMSLRGEHSVATATVGGVANFRYMTLGYVLQHLWLVSQADTIDEGSNAIKFNMIAERALHMSK